MNYQNYCWLLKLELQKVEDVYVYAGILSDKWHPVTPVSQAFSLFEIYCVWPCRTTVTSPRECEIRQSRTKAKPLPSSVWINTNLSLNEYYFFILFLLQEGFDTLDPFIPILVSNYNPKEFEACIQYYLENNWLQHEKGQLLNFSSHRRTPLSQTLDLFFPQEQPVICFSSLFPFYLDLFLAD